MARQRAPFVVDIPELAGKTVASARQESGDSHLDGDYAQDGPVIIEFTDGTALIVESYWCNDDTSGIEFSIKPA
jgi:hypothetical protein